MAGPGDAEAAERSMRQAAGLAAQRQARGFQPRAVTSLARLWCAQGRVPQARALPGEV